MKIRQSHVTNSSSSSFVVLFPLGRPKTVEELKIMLFGDQKEIDLYDYTITTQRAAEKIFAQLKDQKGKPIHQIPAQLTTGYGDWSIDLDTEKFKDEEGNIDWDAYTAAENAAEEKSAQEFSEKWIKRLPSGAKEWYLFTFSDNDGREGAVLEHGEVFERVISLQISHH